MAAIKIASDGDEPELAEAIESMEDFIDALAKGMTVKLPKNELELLRQQFIARVGVKANVPHAQEITLDVYDGKNYRSPDGEIQSTSFCTGDYKHIFLHWNNIPKNLRNNPKAVMIIWKGIAVHEVGHAYMTRLVDKPWNSWCQSHRVNKLSLFVRNIIEDARVNDNMISEFPGPPAIALNDAMRLHSESWLQGTKRKVRATIRELQAEGKLWEGRMPNGAVQSLICMKGLYHRWLGGAIDEFIAKAFPNATAQKLADIDKGAAIINEARLYTKWQGEIGPAAEELYNLLNKYNRPDPPHKDDPKGKPKKKPKIECPECGSHKQYEKVPGKKGTYRCPDCGNEVTIEKEQGQDGDEGETPDVIPPLPPEALEEQDEDESDTADGDGSGQQQEGEDDEDSDEQQTGDGSEGDDSEDGDDQEGDGSGSGESEDEGSEEDGQEGDGEGGESKDEGEDDQEGESSGKSEEKPKDGEDKDGDDTPSDQEDWGDTETGGEGGETPEGDDKEGDDEQQTGGPSEDEDSDEDDGDGSDEGESGDGEDGEDGEEGEDGEDGEEGDGDGSSEGGDDQEGDADTDDFGNPGKLSESEKNDDPDESTPVQDGEAPKTWLPSKEGGNMEEGVPPRVYKEFKPEPAKESKHDSNTNKNDGGGTYLDKPPERNKEEQEWDEAMNQAATKIPHLRSEIPRMNAYDYAFRKDECRARISQMRDWIKFKSKPKMVMEPYKPNGHMMGHVLARAYVTARRQEVTDIYKRYRTELEDSPVEIAFMSDISGSTNASEMQNALLILGEAARGTIPDSALGLFAFGEWFHVIKNFNEKFDVVKTRIGQVADPRGFENPWAFYAIENILKAERDKKPGFQKNTVRVFVVLSDFQWGYTESMSKPGVYNNAGKQDAYKLVRPVIDRLFKEQKVITLFVAHSKSGAAQTSMSVAWIKSEFGDDANILELPDIQKLPEGLMQIFKKLSAPEFRTQIERALTKGGKLW